MTPSDNTATDSLVKEQLTLLIEQELRYQLDDILQRMQTLATDFRIDLKTDKKGNMQPDKKSERSALRNLLITATDRTASLETIKNYIAYQSARSEDVGATLKNPYSGDETNPYGCNKFSEALIGELDNLRKDAEDIFERIKLRLSPESKLKQYLMPNTPERDVADLHIKLVQLYLGYLVRQHTSMRVSK